MSGRFALTSSAAQCATRYGCESRLPDTPPRYNIAPGQEITALIRTDRLTLARFHWGIVPAWMRSDPGQMIFNARAETLREKAIFHKLLSAKRCLIPAHGFFEWMAAGGAKIPLYVCMTSGAPFLIAGLYNCPKGSSPEDGG
ncbi:MAG: SOS response-associated peptidase, partial [Spirochaetota bacterium]